MDRRRFLLVARVIVFIAACFALLNLLEQAVPVIEQVTYANAYADGGLRRGEISQEKAASIVKAEYADGVTRLSPLALQAVGVLGIAWMLIRITGRLDQPPR